MSIYRVLKSRASEINGQLADPKDVERLRERLATRNMPDLLRVFTELPVCGIVVSFRVDGETLSARSKLQPSNGRDDFEPGHDHEFDWMTPAMIVEEIEDTFAGPSVFEAGFLPIGMRTSGGDSYFLRTACDSKAKNPLMEVYYDWVDPNDANPLCKESKREVWPSVYEVLTRALIK